VSQVGENPYVFVVGCPRSGTTLLQRMLDHHPQLAVANDAAFIWKAIKAVSPELKKRIKSGEDPALWPPIVDFLLQFKGFARLGLPDDRVRDAASRSATYGSFVRALYDEFAKLNGKPLAGEKAPDYVRRLPVLHGLFPQARFIHIIRDGRNVALSTFEWVETEPKGPCRFALWNESRIGAIAMWWRWLVGTGRKDGTTLGPSLYREIRYERLVDEPELVLRELMDFLSLPFAEEMLHYHKDKESYAPALSTKSAWLPPTRGLRDWTSQMQREDVALFESLAGDLLSELGYGLVTGEPPAAVRATAEHCRRWWHSDAAHM
jgi:hypothetical protein